MILTDRRPQFQADLATLARIVEGLERLDVRWEQGRASIGARQRGYFTPEEEDRVRQLLLAYRNYRLSAYGRAQDLAPPFDLAGLVLQASDGRPHEIPDHAALEHLRAIQGGMWPSRDLRM